MGEAVQQGRGQPLVAKDLRPARKSEIGGEDECGGMLMPSKAELKQRLRSRRREGLEHI
jgi:hypothetical protein